ncbi:hypothetical protein ACSBR2_036396 [Camellia fascicularis]
MPKWLWKLSPQLDWLDLSYNQVCGLIPNTLEFCPFALALVNLSFNRLEGQFPLWHNLSILHLGNSSLLGPIPEKINTEIPNLSVLYLFENFLSGNISSSIVKMKNLEAIDLLNNIFSGEIPRNCQYATNWHHRSIEQQSSWKISKLNMFIDISLHPKIEHQPSPWKNLFILGELHKLAST